MRVGGSLVLPERPLFLAPMEDVTDRSFRLLCKRYGADMVFTEFVNSDGLTRGARSLLEKLTLMEEERPAGIQIYGQHEESMVEAACIAEEQNPELIDLNFGCPVKKIAGRGAGAGMLREPSKLVSIAGSVVRAVKVPVSVKTRLGWDSESIIIEDLVERLQDVGVSMVTIHGRTRAQLYTGKADWNWISRVKSNRRIHIPIVGNGDITSVLDASRAFWEYGVDAVMIGRATYGKPWIFREIRHYLETGEELAPASISERVSVAREHLRLSVQYKGVPRGIFELRRHLCTYFKGLPHFKQMRLDLVTELDPEVLDARLESVGRKYSDWEF